MSDRGPVIRLQGGPGDGQAFDEQDFRERIIAAHRMGRATPDGPGWATRLRAVVIRRKLSEGSGSVLWYGDH